MGSGWGVLVVSLMLVSPALAERAVPHAATAIRADSPGAGAHLCAAACPLDDDDSGDLDDDDDSDDDALPSGPPVQPPQINRRLGHRTTSASLLPSPDSRELLRPPQVRAV